MTLWDDFREKIREAVDFPALVAETVSLSGSPNGHKPVMVRCPWHDDHSPSLAVYADHATCYGVCAQTWDVFGWAMKAWGVDFITARNRLAERYHIPRPHWTPEQERAAQECRQIEDVLAQAAGYWKDRLWSPDGVDVLDYARRRGWTDETIHDAGLGASGGDLAGHLRAQGVDLSSKGARAALSMPAGMLVYVHHWAGRAEYASGRLASATNKAHYNPPSDWAGPRRSYYNHVYTANAPAVVLVEGQADAVTLAQWGIPALALAGCGGLPDRDLAAVKQHGTIYIALDANTAGREGTHWLAEALGPLARIVTLPDGADDVNAWLQQGTTGEDFQALLDNAKTWLDCRIEEAAQTQGAARDRAVEALFPLLAQLPPITLARYKGCVTRALKEIGAREFDRLLRAVLQDDRSAPAEVLEGRYPVIAPALDFLDGLAVVTVSLLAMADGRPTHLPYLVTSDRQVLAVDGGQMVTIGGRTVILRDPPTVLGNAARWEYSEVQAYLKGNIPDPVQVYLEAERLLDKFIDFRDEGTSDVLALWLMSTYLYPLFEAFPYIALMGPKGSGKTKLIGLVARLAFNGRVTSNVSPASLFRVVQATRGMLGIDEAERLANPKDPIAADLRLLLNAGYKRGSPAIRCEGDDHHVVEFEVYGPKMIASIRGLEDVLESRCILINMLRTAGPKGNLVISEYGEDWVRARHGLYCFALTHFAGVRDRYLNGAGADGLSNRQAELWRPLLAIAAYLDGLGAEGLLAQVQNYAQRKATQAEEYSLDDWRRALLLALYRLAISNKDCVMPKEVTSAMAEFMDTDNHAQVTPQWAGYRLREFGFQRERTRKGSTYIIPRDAVLDVLERYGVPTLEEGNEGEGSKNTTSGEGVS